MNMEKTSASRSRCPGSPLQTAAAAAAKVRRKEKGRGKGADKCKVNGKSRRRETKRLLDT